MVRKSGNEKKLKVKIEAESKGVKEGAQQLDLFSTSAEKASESSEKLNEAQKTNAQSSDKVTKALEKETNAIKEYTEAIKENTEAVEENNKVKKSYQETTLFEGNTKVGLRTRRSESWQDEYGIKQTRSEQHTFREAVSKALPTKEDIAELTAWKNNLLKTYKTNISEIVSDIKSKTGFNSISIKKELDELSARGIKTGGLFGKVNRIDESLTELGDTSKLEKSFKNLISKFSVGKTNAEEFKSALKDLIEDGLNKVNSSVDPIINRITELARGIKESSSAVKEWSEESRKSAEETIKNLSSGFNESKKTIEDFSKINFDEIRSKLKSIEDSGLSVQGLRKETDRLEREYKSLNDTITTTQNKLNDLKIKFDNNEISEEKFNKESKELNNVLKTTKDRVSKLEGDFNSLGENIVGAAKKAKGLSGILSGLGNRIKIFFQYRAINTTLTSIKDTIKAAINLEAAFANIQAITSASDKDMSKLSNTILKVGEASKYSTEEIADATVTLGQAGLTADEINNVLETTTQLAAATGSSLQNTVDLMTSALAVWGLNSEEASHLSDVMVTGMNRTKATLETFRMAVQYAGATMASLNVKFDEFGAVASAAANAGLRASVVGTGLRAVTSELISPTTKMVKGLAKLGLTTEDVNVESQGLVNVLQKLKDAGLDASNAYSLFGRRAAQFILAAQGQLDVVNELQLAFVESGATLKAYNIQMNTVAAEWTALANTVKEAGYKILNETDGFLHDMIVKLKNGIRTLFFDEIDDVNDQIKEVENRIGNLKRYSDLVKQFKSTDYKGDSERQLQQFNSLVKSLNTVYGLNIDIAGSVEGIADRYDDVIKKVEELRKESYRERNQWIESGRQNILNEQLDNFKYDRPLVSQNISLGDYARGSGEFLSFINDPEKSSEFRASLQKTYDDFIAQFLSSGGQIDETYSRIIKEENDKFESELLKITDKMANGELDDTAAQELADVKNIQHSIIINAVEAAKKAIDRLPDLKSYKQDILLEQKVGELTDTYNSIMEDINTSLDKNEKNVVKYQEATASVLEQTNTRLTGRLSELESVFEGLSEEDKKLLGKENVELIEAKITELKTKATNKLNDLVTGWIDGIIKIFEAKGDVKARENFEKLDANVEQDALSKAIKNAKQGAKDTRNASRTAREIERDKAREFNKKYQNLKLQSQADSYAQDIAEARRKGVMSKLQTQDTTGTLSSYYSSTAADLSKLESLKTAISNKETLEKYKKDYGDLFNQVKSGKVTLEDADNKTASLIKEMMDLDKNVEAAEAEFGNLNDVDLSDLNGQITTLQDKLNNIEKSTESEFGKLTAGFSATIESMSKSYGSAKLGSMIAEDLGNGVSDALYAWSQGTKTMKEAFSDMARSILDDISKMLIKMAVLKAMESAVGLSFGSGQQVYDSPIGPTQSGSFMLEANGGFIPKIRAALGTSVKGGIQGRDSVPAMLMPGEYVLRKSAVDALGTNFLNDLNNNAAQTLTNTAANLTQNNNEDSAKESEPAVVNVWVVSKEEEAKMGPNDVIATISKDIMTGGTTKRLIQQVVAGRK